MNKEIIIDKLWRLRELLRSGYLESPTSAIQLIDGILKDMYTVEDMEDMDDMEDMEDMEDMGNYDKFSNDVTNGAVSMDDFVDPYHNYRIRDCILSIPRFARELVNTTCSTVNGYVLPSDVEQIIPAMRYTPTVLYLLVITVLLDMGIPVVYNEVEMNAFDYTEFRCRLAKVLTCALGADSDAVAQNIYSVDEELDMYEDFVATIDDALLVSLKTSN